MTISMPRMDRLPAQERGVTIGDFLVPIRDLRAAPHAGASPRADPARHRADRPDGPGLHPAWCPVPFTGQTFGVLLSAGALGLPAGRAGLCAVPRAGRRSACRSSPRATHGARDAARRRRRLPRRVRRRLGDRRASRGARLGPATSGPIGAMLLGSVAIYAIGVPVARLRRTSVATSPRRSPRARPVPAVGRGEARPSRPPRSRPRGGSSAAGRATAEQATAERSRDRPAQRAGDAAGADAAEARPSPPSSSTAGSTGRASEAWRLNREAMLLLGAGPRALLLQIAHSARRGGRRRALRLPRRSVGAPVGHAPLVPPDRVRDGRRGAGRDSPPERAPPRDPRRRRSSRRRAGGTAGATAPSTRT